MCVLVLLLVAWMDLPIPMQFVDDVGQDATSNNVSDASLGGLKAEKGAGIHECLDVLPEFTVDPMFMDGEMFAGHVDHSRLNLRS